MFNFVCTFLYMVIYYKGKIFIKFVTFITYRDILCYLVLRNCKKWICDVHSCNHKSSPLDQPKNKNLLELYGS